MLRNKVTYVMLRMLRKVSKALKLVYQLIIIYMENKSLLESKTTFDERFKVTSVSFVIADVIY